MFKYKMLIISYFSPPRMLHRNEFFSILHTLPCKCDYFSGT